MGNEGVDKKGKRKNGRRLQFSVPSPTPLRVSRPRLAVDLTLYEAVAAC